MLKSEADLNAESHVVAEPRCPACEHKPLNFAHNIVITQSQAVLSIAWCGDCGHTISLQYLGQNQPQAPKIIVPQ